MHLSSGIFIPLTSIARVEAPAKRQNPRYQERRSHGTTYADSAIMIVPLPLFPTRISFPVPTEWTKVEEHTASECFAAVRDKKLGHAPLVLLKRRVHSTRRLPIIPPSDSNVHLLLFRIMPEKQATVDELAACIVDEAEPASTSYMHTITEPIWRRKLPSSWCSDCHAHTTFNFLARAGC